MGMMLSLSLSLFTSWLVLKHRLAFSHDDDVILVPQSLHPLADAEGEICILKKQTSEQSIGL